MKTITEFISEQKSNIDTTIFDLIYNIIINDEWIYITKEIVVEWFGYKENKSTMSAFYKKLNKDYEKDIDFKQVDQNNEIVKKVTNLLIIKNDLVNGNRKKYYLVTNKTLILLLMKSKNTKSLRILEHFYYIYDLLFKYYEYQAEQLKLEYTTELNKIKDLEHSKKYTIQQDIKYKILEEQNESGTVYFVYESENENFFKIGFTNNDLEKRLSCLQTGNRRVLKIYKFIECKNASELEQITHNKFEKYKVVNEWYKITKKDIDAYIINYDLANLTKNLTI